MHGDGAKMPGGEGACTDCDWPVWIPPQSKFGSTLVHCAFQHVDDPLVPFQTTRNICLELGQGLFVCSATRSMVDNSVFESLRQHNHKHFVTTVVLSCEGGHNSTVFRGNGSEHSMPSAPMFSSILSWCNRNIFGLSALEVSCLFARP